jgi:hypothetical protein
VAKQSANLYSNIYGIHQPEEAVLAEKSASLYSNIYGLHRNRFPLLASIFPLDLYLSMTLLQLQHASLIFDPGL